LDRLVPKSIAEHKYHEIFAKEWLMIHNRMEGNSFNFFIGSNGTGKTYAALKRAEIMGVDEQDSYGTLFDPDHLENHLFFDKQDMLNKIAELEKLSLKDRRGYQLILDEAQMTANAKEWNNKEVLGFSKDMTTIRSSRLNIVMTMPTHRMITTDLRQLGAYQVEMLPADTINLKKGISYSKLHFLKLNPHLGEIWRTNPQVRQVFKNCISRLSTSKQGKLRRLGWTLPSKTTRKNYEEMKQAFRDKTAELNAKKQLEPETKKSLTQMILEDVREKLDNYRDPVKGFSWAKIIKDYNCGTSTAYQIVKVLNSEAMGDDKK
jgi:hypothetical protein